MLNPNQNQCGAQWTDLSVMKTIMGDLIGILCMLAVQIIGKQTNTKATIQLRDVNRKNELEET